MSTMPDVWGTTAANNFGPGQLEETIATSWSAVDLTDVLAGRWQPPQPTVGRRGDGRGLFYPGKAHAVVSETEAGKTWLALSVAVDEITAGNDVVYIDFEDDEGMIVGRLLTLYNRPDEIDYRFHYVRPDTPLRGQAVDELDELMGNMRPTLVVLDGVTEAMTMHGMNPLDNVDIAKFGRLITKRLTATGAAVVSLDHVVKDREGRGRYGLGGVHKLNGLTGAQYVLANRTPFGIGITGRSTIAIAKDRPGQLRAHALPSAGGMHWYGDLVVTSHGEELTEVEIQPPHQRDQAFRPTALMGKIAELLAGGPLSQRRICDAINGKSETKRQALSFLIVDGYVTEKTPHTLLKPYEIQDSE